METWLVVFVGVTAATLLLQTLVLVGMYVRIRRMNQLFRNRVEPLLDRLDDILRTVQGNSLRILEDLTAMAETARRQAEKFDRVTDELTDRVRLQIIRMDELLARMLGAVEAAGRELERALRGPVREAMAVVRGVKTALDYLARRRRESATPRPGERTGAEEELFI